MKRSFLNVVSVDGKLFRIAEFGFFADTPSFSGEGIIFRQGDSYKRIDLVTGMIAPSEPPNGESDVSPDGNYTVRTEFASKVTNGCGYVHLILRDNKKSTETVLTRFMGCNESVGAMPFSEDSKRIVFFGYPENELG